MKNLFFISLLMLIQVVNFAQSVAINETGLPAEPTSLLDITSTTKGLLIPRMRTIERLAIVSPAEGLFVYDIDTHTFWYSTNSVWKEILKTGDGGFTLPYVGTGSDPGKLFSITNTNAANSTTIFGRRLGGSGLGLSMSNAIWGDDLNGNGVAGTSDSGNGIAGFSNTGIGVSATSIGGPGMYSISTNGFGLSCTSQTNFGLGSVSFGADKAGVVGANGNSTGIGYGVIGLIENPTGGAAVWGKNNAVAGHGGLFTIVNSVNADPGLKVTTNGNGEAGLFNILNPNNTKPALDIIHEGNGSGIKLSLNKPTGSSNGIDVITQGTGIGIRSQCDNGTAGYFENNDPSGTDTTMIVQTRGFGSTLSIKSLQTNNNSDVLDILNQGYGAALNINSVNGRAIDAIISDANSPNTAVNIANGGKGNVLFINNYNPTNNGTIMRVINNGTGKFIDFENSNGDDRMVVDNLGNITSAGSVTVNNNKGIVRNSTSSQMRLETLVSPYFEGSIPNGATWSENIVFSSSFPIPPMIFIGNPVNNLLNQESKLIAYISNVTSTGCTINVSNNSPNSIYFTNAWNIMALGY